LKQREEERRKGMMIEQTRGGKEILEKEGKFSVP
jgi:hypothetical protein